jgi:sec-independent protein translocase protein TatA
MMNLGAPEMLLLGLLALILFGPRRLPELGKALGEGLAAFRESSRQLSSEFKRQLEEETTPTPPVPPPTVPTNVLMGTPMQPAPLEAEEPSVAASGEAEMGVIMDDETTAEPEKASLSA